MKKKLLILLPVFLVLTGVVYFATPKSSRKKYEDKINAHAFNQRGLINAKDIKKMPKYDRPDLAWEQNFLQTMNPELGRPTREVLLPIYNEIARFNRAKAGIPGGDINNAWVERGPNNVGGRVRAIMFDPNDKEHKKVWAGAVSGGLWYTNDITKEDATWYSIDNHWENLAISTIAYDPKNPKIFYVGTGEGWHNLDALRGLGIWQTTDAGKTWKHLSNTNSENFKTIQKIAVSKSGRVLAGTNDGLYVSDDQGKTWSITLNGFISDIEIASNGNIFLGQGDRSGGKGVFKSTDNGNNWRNINPKKETQERVELAISPSNPNVVYAVAAGSSSIAWFKKSRNGGGLWTDVTIPKYLQGCSNSLKDFTRGQQWYDLILAVHPKDPNTIIAGGIDLNKSTDGGKTWNSISNWTGWCRPYVHADQHAIVFRPEHENEAVFGNDGGLAFSNNVGNEESPSFIIRNKNFSVTQFYSCAIHPAENKNYYLGGTQDNGTQMLNVKGHSSGEEVTGGDGGFCFIDQKMPNIQITSYTNNNFYYSTNGGREFSKLYSSDDGAFINPAAYDHNLGILYSAKNKTSINRISNIRDIPKISMVEVGDLGTNVSHISVSPYTTETSTIFVGTYAGRLFKISKANEKSPKMKEIGTDLFPEGAISSVIFGTNENEILITFSNYGVTSVWYTADGGKNWDEKEGNLPDMPVRWALFNPNNTKEVLLATEVGVWATKNFDANKPTWTPSNSGLANVRVDMLKIRKSDNQVVAATHGRGLFSSDAFSDIDKNELKALFSSISHDINLGEMVYFENNSYGDADSCLWTFEGGIPATSTENNPSVQYIKAGKYKVTLTIYKGDKKDTKTEEGYVNVQAAGGWVTQPAVAYTKAPRYIEYIDVVNKNVVWATVTVDGKSMMEVTKTIDGGKSWQADTFNIEGDLNIAMICAISKDTAWVPVFPAESGAVGGGIYRTVNGGKTWERQETAKFEGDKAFPNVVYFWDNKNGFCMGDPNDGYFEIYTTADGGENWKRVEKSKIPATILDEEYGTVGYYCVADDGTVFFNTNQGRIFKSTDKGHTWTAITTPLKAGNKCAFADENNGVLIELLTKETPNPKTYKTTDGGKTWTQVDGKNVYNGFIEYVSGSKSMYVTAVGGGNKTGVSFSVDGGETWTASKKQVGSASSAIDFWDMTTGWVGKGSSDPDKGGIAKYQGTTTIPDFKMKITDRKKKEVVFTDITLSKNETLNYQWDFGKDAEPKTAKTKGAHTVTYSTEGLKHISLTVNGVIIKKDLSVSTTAVKEIKKEKTELAKVYPNPSDNEITVHFISTKLTAKYINVYKSNGQLVYSGKINNGNKKTLALAKYGKGMYLIKVSDGSNTNIHKVIIN